MAVKKLQNAYYVTGDMDRAVAFYRDALGLGLKFQDAGRWAQFDAGGVNFSLSSPEEAATGASGAVVIFEVDDLDTVRMRLAGIDTRTRMPAPTCWTRATWGRTVGR